jgi:hypothetical protein
MLARTAPRAEGQERARKAQRIYLLPNVREARIGAMKSAAGPP